LTVPTTSEAARRQMWRRYVAGGRSDDALRNQLIELELPRLEQIASHQFHRLGYRVPADELLQVGAVGLMLAARNYDPTARSTFFSFASRRAVGAMLDHVRELDHAPRLVRQQEARRKRFETVFADRHDREPTDAEIRRGLGWSSQQLAESRSRGMSSLDAPAYENDAGDADSFRDLLTACDDGPHAGQMTEAFFQELTRGFSMDDQALVWLYFVRQATMSRIAIAYGVSESRISQQLAAIKQRLLLRWSAIDAAELLAG
jgi:RNA polymerase sigma factor for flagellar operon FliA